MKYRFKTKPYHHQVKALKKLLSNGFGGALLMEPRTGKTKTVIDYMSILAKGGKVRRVIIVCPLSVIGVWEDEIGKHCPYRTNIIIWDRVGRQQHSLPESPKAINIVVLNYDAFAISDKRSKFGQKALRAALRSWGADLMVLDESHRVKSPSARKTYYIWSTAWDFGRSRVMPKECLIPYRVIMTGTPVTKGKRLFDIYSQWKFLNPERFQYLGTYDLFKSHFGKWFDNGTYEVWKGNRNEDELKEQIGKDAFMVKREECFDLPPRTDQIIPIPLSKETRRVYDEMEEEMLSKLANGEITTASIRLVQSLRLAQITSGLAKSDKGTLYAVGSEKLDVLTDILTDLFEADEKVIIAARFRGDHARLKRLGRKLRVPVYGVLGGQNRGERDRSIREFREHTSKCLMIVQPQAASLGIDLSTASVMVWYSLTNSFVDFSQTCDRIALSDRKTSFLYLLAEDTVDFDLYASLQTDGDVAASMLERLKVPG